MILSFIGLLISIGTVVFVIKLLNEHAGPQRELDVLLQSGVRLRGRLLTVEGGSPAGRAAHTRYFTVPITVELERESGREQVQTSIVVPETLRQLVQAGAPVVAVVSAADPKRLCLVEISNSFGVSTPVTLGSMYSRW